VEGAGIAGGRIAVGVSGGDGDGEGRTGRAAGRRAEAQAGRGGRADGDARLGARDAGSCRVRGSDRLASGRLQSGAERVDAPVGAREGVVAREHCLAITAGEVDRAGVTGGDGAGGGEDRDRERASRPSGSRRREAAQLEDAGCRCVHDGRRGVGRGRAGLAVLVGGREAHRVGAGGCVGMGGGSRGARAAVAKVPGVAEAGGRIDRARVGHGRCEGNARTGGGAERPTESHRGRHRDDLYRCAGVALTPGVVRDGGGNQIVADRLADRIVVPVADIAEGQHARGQVNRGIGRTISPIDDDLVRVRGSGIGEAATQSDGTPCADVVGIEGQIHIIGSHDRAIEKLGRSHDSRDNRLVARPLEQVVHPPCTAPIGCPVQKSFVESIDEMLVIFGGIQNIEGNLIPAHSLREQGAPGRQAGRIDRPSQRFRIQGFEIAAVRPAVVSEEFRGTKDRRGQLFNRAARLEKRHAAR